MFVWTIVKRTIKFRLMIIISTKKEFNSIFHISYQVILRYFELKDLLLSKSLISIGLGCTSVIDNHESMRVSKKYFLLKQTFQRS